MRFDLLLIGMQRGHAEMMEDFGVGQMGRGMPSFLMCKCIYCKLQISVSSSILNDYMYFVLRSNNFSQKPET
jgi:hypothetical protein